MYVHRTDFLVYGECSCGWRCACPEGYRWPDCPVCDRKILPLRDRPYLRRDGSEGKQGLGYVALLTFEQDAAKAAKADGYDFERTSWERMFAADDVIANVDARTCSEAES